MNSGCEPCRSLAAAIATPRSSRGIPDSRDQAAKELPSGVVSTPPKSEITALITQPGTPTVSRSRTRPCPRGPPGASGRSPRARPGPRGQRRPGHHRARHAPRVLLARHPQLEAGGALAAGGVVDRGEAGVLHRERLAVVQQPPDHLLLVVAGRPPGPAGESHERVGGVEHRRDRAERIEVVPHGRRARLGHRSRGSGPPGPRPCPPPRRRGRSPARAARPPRPGRTRAKRRHRAPRATPLRPPRSPGPRERPWSSSPRTGASCPCARCRTARARDRRTRATARGNSPFEARRVTGGLLGRRALDVVVATTRPGAGDR